MLVEALAALATAGGTAVVQAIGTDAWEAVRERIARLFGRHEDRQAQLALERLDQTAGAVEQADPDRAEHVRTRQEAAWQSRFEDLLESLNEAERMQAASELRELVELARTAGSVSAGDSGLAAGRDIEVHAENHAVAGGVIRGSVHMGNPPTAGADED
ncbi:hypothetical protein [Kitasatospora cinereorecta]|uniref:Uncharacterized protein n=1 Tax=Kitasatospora cinereorecta TaxID=285560 RepID=A0ABW0VR03_9ACTN